MSAAKSATLPPTACAPDEQDEQAVHKAALVCGRLPAGSPTILAEQRLFGKQLCCFAH